MRRSDASSAKGADPLCPHCGAVLDVQRALAQDAPLLTGLARASLAEDEEGA